MFYPLHMTSCFFLLILFSSTPVQAAFSYSQTCIDNKDNVLTITGASLSEIDSVLTFIDHISEQDATKTQHPNDFPYPPEPPRNDTVVQLLKESARFDNRKSLVLLNRILHVYISFTSPDIHPPGESTSYIFPEHLRYEILRI